MTRAFAPREWTEAEDALLGDLFAAGTPLWKIGQKLHVAPTTASMRLRSLGLKNAIVEPIRTERFTCGHCGTRSDAVLDFGCGQCLPLRRSVA